MGAKGRAHSTRGTYRAPLRRVACRSRFEAPIILAARRNVRYMSCVCVLITYIASIGSRKPFYARRARRGWGSCVPYRLICLITLVVHRIINNGML